MIDLRPDYLDIVKKILAEQVPDCEVRAFGSRVTWTAKDYSDLDLVVVGDGKLESRRLAKLRTAFEESTLSIRVDVLDWHAIPESFKDIISQKYEVLQKAEKEKTTDEWQTVPFAQLLAEPVRNGIYKPKAFHGRGSNIVNMGELFAYPRLRAVSMKKVELSESEKERFTLSKGDLLFARRSLVAEGAGKCSIVLDIDGPTTFESSIIRARPDCTKAEPLFLYYFFNSTAGLHCLDTIRRQVAVAGITGSDLSRLEIPVPPISVQRAIAHILGTLDDKIELNRKRNETLEAMARVLFKSWFVDFDPVRAKAEGRDTGLPKELADLFPDRLVDSELGEIPEGWEVKTIDDFADIVGGSTPSTKDPEYWDEGTHSWATPKDLSALPVPVLLDTERRISDAGLAQIGSGLLPAGTVLLSSRAPVGYLAITEIPVAINQGFIAMKPKSEIPSLYLLLWAHHAQEEILSRANGSTFMEISKSNFRPIPVVRPKNIVLRAFTSLGMPLYRRIVENTREASILSALRDTLLPKLISGELKVKDAARTMLATNQV
ncbi:MAG TPA: restriction endonuclease subunit S [bacterium]|nr:restriction endonuclease subunit S [bacterium]